MQKVVKDSDDSNWDSIIEAIAYYLDEVVVALIIKVEVL